LSSHNYASHMCYQINLLQLQLAYYPESTSSWIEASMGCLTSGSHTYFILHSNYKNGRKMFVLFTEKQ